MKKVQIREINDVNTNTYLIHELMSLKDTKWVGVSTCLSLKEFRCCSIDYIEYLIEGVSSYVEVHKDGYTDKVVSANFVERCNDSLHNYAIIGSYVSHYYGNHGLRGSRYCIIELCSGKKVKIQEMGVLK